MQALVRFSHIAAGGTLPPSSFTPHVVGSLGTSAAEYKLSSLRYDLSKLRAKGLVVRILGSRRYRLLPEGYRLSVVLLKLFHKLYAPLSSGLLQMAGDRSLA
jgi:hypothetical protein